MDKFAIIFQPQNLQLYWTGFLATMELLAISLVAALGPAIAAYRTDPARVLKGG